MSSERLASIRSLLAETGDDALVLTAQEDIRWACGFSGSSGVLVIAHDHACLFTDGRYAQQAPAEASSVDVRILTGDVLAGVGEEVGSLSLRSIVVDGAQTAFAAVRRMQSWPLQPEIHSFESFLGHLIAVKDADEIDRMRRAQAVTDAVFDEILGLIHPGISEKEVAAEIVYRHLTKGADGMSFDPIVASGPNGALPHARPGNRQLAVGDLVVLDFGCFVDGYASDMTRTVGIGKPPDEALDSYETVRTAQGAAQRVARAGIEASDVDKAARDVIVAAGLGGAFTHGTGHGLGLRIHEAPRLAATNDEILPEHAVVTIEPGVYIPGRFGVRIENAVVLEANGCIPLPKSPTDLILL